MQYYIFLVIQPLYDLFCWNLQKKKKRKKKKKRYKCVCPNEAATICFFWISYLKIKAKFIDKLLLIITTASMA